MLLYAYKHNKNDTKYNFATALPTSPDGYSHQLLKNVGISPGLLVNHSVVKVFM